MKFEDIIDGINELVKERDMLCTYLYPQKAKTVATLRRREKNIMLIFSKLSSGDWKTHVSIDYNHNIQGHNMFTRREVEEIRSKEDMKNVVLELESMVNPEFVKDKLEEY